ncbi:hypothetical protein JNK13_03705 [bacterium]|nr:hypothetical protein [bacterium]
MDRVRVSSGLSRNFALHLSNNERGLVLEFVAISIVFIVLLAIGMMVDVPMNQSSATATQIALDEAAKIALANLPSYQEVGDRATKAAYHSIVAHSSSFSTLEVEPIVVMPRMGAGVCAQLDDDQGCYLNTGYSGDIQLAGQIGSRYVFDPHPNIDDFKNIALVYARTEPRRFLTLDGLNQYDSEVVAGARIPTQLTYVLIDPAFSMDAENYDAILHDLDWAPDPDRWGSAAPFPGITNAPPTAEYHNGGANYLNDIDAIPAFYGSLCETRPWGLYKETIVEMLDWMSKSSVFNSTTLVGLTGIKDHPVIPIYPIVDNDILVSHLDINGDLSLSPLQSGLSSAFTGFVNTKTPKIVETGDDPDSIPASNRNMWELCYCSAFAASDGAHKPYLLPVDSYNDYFAGDTERDLYHISPEKRQRGIQFMMNWCDDSIHEVDQDFRVNLGLHRSMDAAGESVRNLIASQGMRIRNLKLETIDNRSISSFEPPKPEDQDWNSKNSPMATGTRSLHLSFGADSREPATPPPTAVDYLIKARDEYNTDLDQVRYRPISQDSVNLLIFAFGVVDQPNMTAEREVAGAGYEGLLQFYFDFALQHAVCTLGANLTFVFLPMSESDRESLRIVAPVLEAYSQDYLFYHGKAESGAGKCANGSMGAVRVMITDYMSTDFGNETTPVSLRKLRAARHFRATIPGKLKNLFLKSVSSL